MQQGDTRSWAWAVISQLDWLHMHCFWCKPDFLVEFCSFSNNQLSLKCSWSSMQQWFQILCLCVGIIICNPHHTNISEWWKVYSCHIVFQCVVLVTEPLLSYCHGTTASYGYTHKHWRSKLRLEAFVNYCKWKPELQSNDFSNQLHCWNPSLHPLYLFFHLLVGTFHQEAAFCTI